MTGKVLMLSYYYPPLGGIGMLRSLKFAKYLPEFGWTPVVLTPEKGVHAYYCENEYEGILSGVEVVRTGYFDLVGWVKGLFRIPRKSGGGFRETKGTGAKKENKFFSRLAKEWLFFPDQYIGWYYHAVQKGLEVAGEKDIAALYSTSSPVTAHLIAHNIKHKTALPWIADLRDLWTQNPYYTKNFFVTLLEKTLERHILGYADALVTVSAPMADKLAGLHKKNVYVITNGFDEEDFTGLPVKSESKFIISHTGQLYNLKRSPEPLCKALASLAAKGAVDLARIELRFFGEIDTALQKLVDHYKLGGAFLAPGMVPYKQSLGYQVSSTVLLLLEWGHQESGDIYTGKLFEYLGARRPVLALTRDGSIVTDLLHESGAGEAVAMDNENWQDELEEVLSRWYREFVNTGQVSYHGSEKVIQRYTRRKVAGELAALLDKISLYRRGAIR